MPERKTAKYITSNYDKTYIHICTYVYAYNMHTNLHIHTYS